MRLAAVRIFVDDLDRAGAFYEDVIGLTRSVTTPTAILFEDAPSIIVELADDDALREGLLGRFTGVSFETGDVHALHSQLKARNVPMHGPPEKQDWGGVMLFAHDPAGNVVTFVQYPGAPGESR